MSDQITYNPGAVSDFASDVGSRAGQLHMIYEDTASKTNALQEFFAGHGAQGFFDAQAQMLSGLQGLIETVGQHGTTLVALQAGVGPEKSARILVGDSTVAIVDTAAGRICVESVTSGQRRYQVLSPGSRSDIGGAVQRLIRRLPAGDEWYSYRRVV